ncbi:MAG: beta-galactosidase trimerization domain-containing protein, partial [Sedimentisphaerales bacterium]|nr:beta-galactosidase trimerization domain-containing protein [Sedimentisphaerales bacterium]
MITEDMDDYSGAKTIIINNAVFMSEAEVDRIHHFVAGGGTLIVTGMTSYYNKEGQTSGDFALKDVFGVSYSGKNAKKISYLVPRVGEMVACHSPGALVEAATAEVLGNVAEPEFEIFDADHYASIHSNPPGPTGQHAGLTLNSFGEGKCVYLYSSLLALQQHAQQSFGQALFKEHINTDLTVHSNAPRCVEVTLLKSTQKEAYLVCLVNYQAELPNVPIYDLTATVRLPEPMAIKSCRRVSDGKEINCQIEEQKVTIQLSRLDVVEMIELL